MSNTAKKNNPRIDLNPSSADRWTTCTASPMFIFDNWDRLPPRDTVFNTEGTTAHEVASALLQDRKPRVNDPYHCPVPPDEEMHVHAWNYMEYIQDLCQPGAEVLIEQKLPLWYMEGRNAIVDAVVINHDGIHVIDYKYGAGIVVSPERNKQTAIYAKCVTPTVSSLYHGEIPNNFPITSHIYQPRGRAAVNSPSHIWESTWGEIQEMAGGIEKAAKDILIGGLFPENNLKFAPSEKACQWCPAKGFCTERQRLITKDIEVLAVIDEKPKHFPPVKAISAKQLSAVLTHKAQIIKWLNDAEDFALEHLKAGHKLPGWKLVMSNGGHRYWTNPKQAEKLLQTTTILRESEFIERKLASPAAVEKLLGKHGFGVELTNLIAKPPGSLVLAPESDKRDDAAIKAEDIFEALD